MNVSLGEQLSHQLKALEHALHEWTADGRKQIVKAHRQVGQRWRSEAARRVPVDSGRLRQQLLENTYEESQAIITEVGSNVTSDKGAPYPVYLEFGTKYIAGGRVQKLGFDPHVTDAQAITLWPAKVLGMGRMDKQGFRRGARISSTTGLAKKRVVDAVQKRLAKGGADEQMPWLRASFWRIRDWAVEHIDAAIDPPDQQGGAA